MKIIKVQAGDVVYTTNEHVVYYGKNTDLRIIDPDPDPAKIHFHSKRDSFIFLIANTNQKADEFYESQIYDATVRSICFYMNEKVPGTTYDAYDEL